MQVVEKGNLIQFGLSRMTKVTESILGLEKDYYKCFLCVPVMDHCKYFSAATASYVPLIVAIYECNIFVVVVVRLPMCVSNQTLVSKTSNG